MAVCILNRLSLRNNPYHEWLKDYPESIVLLTSQESMNKYNDDVGLIKEHYSHVEVIPNYDSSSTLEELIEELSEKYSFTQIIALSESDILRAAKIREYLGVEGQNYKSALSFRDKIIMKDAMKDALPEVLPNYKRIISPLDLMEFVKNYGFPIFIKHADGSSAFDTHKIENKEMLRNFLRNVDVSSSNYMIESFVEGNIYHVDGFFYKGDVKLIRASQYIKNGCREFAYGGSLASKILPEYNPISVDLCSLTRIVLDTLPTPLITSFHAEFFRTPEGKYYFCEIASRTGGARTKEVFKYATGIDLNQIFVRSVLNLDIERLFSDIKADECHYGFSVIAPKVGVLADAPQVCNEDFVRDFYFIGKLGKEYAAPSNAVDYIASAIIRTNSYNTMDNNIALFQDWFWENAVLNN